MFAVLAWVCFSFRILRTAFPSTTSFRGGTPFVFLSERQPMAADTLPALVSLSNCLTSSFFRFFSHFSVLDVYSEELLLQGKVRLVGLAFIKLWGGSEFWNSIRLFLI